MRISVITPVFNGERYIEETVCSVLEAIGEKDIEYLVIDDGSTDKTGEILKKYQPKIKVIRQVNSGESSAVNTGFNNASGDFVLVVSADDPLFTPDIFQNVPEYFDSNPDLVVWYPDWQMIDQGGNVIKIVTVDEYSDEKLIGRFLCLPGPGAFIRKSAALSIDGRNAKWKFVGDYDFWLRISRIGRLERRPRVLAQWRFHDESTSISQRGVSMYNERISVIEEFVDRYPIVPKIRRMARGHAHYFAALLAFYAPEIKGKNTLIRAFLLRGGWLEEAQIRVVAYIFFMPLSPKLKPVLIKYLGKWLKGRK